jgi:putative transposase
LREIPGPLTPEELDELRPGRPRSIEDE